MDPTSAEADSAVLEEPFDLFDQQDMGAGQGNLFFDVGPAHFLVLFAPPDGPGFDAGWELDLFGGVRREIEAADADLQWFSRGPNRTRFSCASSRLP